MCLALHRVSPGEALDVCQSGVKSRKRRWGAVRRWGFSKLLKDLVHETCIEFCGVDEVRLQLPRSAWQACEGEVSETSQCSRAGCVTGAWGRLHGKTEEGGTW